MWDFDKLADKIETESREKITNDDVHLVKSVNCGANVYQVSFHPHSNTIMSYGSKYSVKIWNFSEYDLTFNNTFLNKEYVRRVEGHPQTNQIITCSDYGMFKVWDDNGNCVDSYITKNEEHFAMDFHKTFPFVVIGTNESVVILVLTKPKL